MLDAKDQAAAGQDQALAVVPRQPLFPKFLKAIAPFVSKDDTRPILGSVHVHTDHIVATDSYRLARIWFEGMGANDFPKIGDMSPMEGTLDGVNLDGKTFLKALGSIPAKKKRGFRGSVLPILNNVAAIESGPHNVVLGVTNLDESTMFVARRIEGAFPNYEDLFPKDKPQAVVALNASFLGDMAKAVKEFGADHVLIETRTPLKPVIFRAKNAQGGRFEAIQMPVRDADNDHAVDCDVAAAVQQLQHDLTTEVGPGGFSSKAAKNRAIVAARGRLDELLTGGAE